MKPYKIAILSVYVLVSAPIFYYLCYKVMQAINASELMWFLFWIYVPASLLGGIITKVFDDDK